MITFEYYTPSRNPEENERVAEFASSVIWDDGHDVFGPHSTMGVYKDGELIAGMVYHNWHEKAGVLEISGGASSKHWLQPKVLKALFSFPFDMVGAQMVVMRVSEKDPTLVRLLKRFGFEGFLIPRLRGRDENEWILTLTDDAWRSSAIANRR